MLPRTTQITDPSPPPPGHLIPTPEAPAPGGRPGTWCSGPPRVSLDTHLWALDPGRCSPPAPFPRGAATASGSRRPRDAGERRRQPRAGPSASAESRGRQAHWRAASAARRLPGPAPSPPPPGARRRRSAPRLPHPLPFHPHLLSAVLAESLHKPRDREMNECIKQSDGGKEEGRSGAGGRVDK